MLRIVAPLIVLVMLVGTTGANDTKGLKVPVPKSDRVESKTRKQCAWAAIETAGNYMGNKTVKGLTDNYREEATKSVIVAVLNMRRVKASLFVTQLPEIEYLWIDAMLEGGYPVVATFYGGQHMVTLVSYDAKNYKYIDPDAPELEIRSVSRADFIKQWDGVALIVHKE